MSQDASDPIDALKRLVDAVGEQRYPLDREDLYAASGMRPGREEPIQACLATLDQTGRFALVNALQEVMLDGGGLEFTAVLAAALRDEEAAVRGLAAVSLAACETAEATEALLRVARSTEEDDGVRIEAVEALGDVALREELGWAASEEAGGVVGALRELAVDVREEPELRAAAIAAVAVRYETWVPALIDDALASDDPALRLGAIQAMGRNADPVWLPSLEAALFAEEPDERAAAAAAIGEIAEEDGAPMLIDLLDEDLSDLDVVVAAVRALGAIGGEEALDRLRALVTHPDEQVREAANESIEEAVLTAESMEGFGDFEAGAGGDISDPLDDLFRSGREG